MKLHHQYDIIVIGDHPSALLAAGLLAKKDFSVLIVASESHLSRLKARSGQCFDPEPQWILGLTLGSGHRGLLTQVLSELGLGDTQKELDALMTRGGVLVATPDYRVDFSSLENLSFEFKREFNSEAWDQVEFFEVIHSLEKMILEFWSSYPQFLEQPVPQGVWSEWTSQVTRRFSKNTVFERELSQKIRQGAALFKRDSQWSRLKSEGFLKFSLGGQSSELQQSIVQVWKGLLFGLSSQSAEKSSLWDLYQLLILSQGGFGFKGGMSAFRRHLLEIAQKYGAHITHSACQSVYIKGDKFLGIQLEDASEMISARFGGVLGQSFHKILLSDHRSLLRQKKCSVPVGWRFTVALTVKKEGVPQGLPSRLIWQDEQSPALELEILNQTHDEEIDHAECVIYLRVVLPYEISTLSAQYLKKIGLRMICQAKELFPFLDHHRVKQFPDFDRNHELKDLESLYSFGSLEAIPDSLLIYPSGHGTVRDHTGIRNLLAASAEVYPELGTFSIGVAGLEVAAELSRLSKKSQ